MIDFEEKFWGLLLRVNGSSIQLSGHIAPMTADQAREIARGLLEAADAADENREANR